MRNKKTIDLQIAQILSRLKPSIKCLDDTLLLESTDAIKEMIVCDTALLITAPTGTGKTLSIPFTILDNALKERFVQNPKIWVSLPTIPACHNALDNLHKIVKNRDLISSVVGQESGGFQESRKQNVVKYMTDGRVVHKLFQS